MHPLLVRRDVLAAAAAAARALHSLPCRSSLVVRFRGTNQPRHETASLQVTTLQIRNPQWRGYPFFALRGEDYRRGAARKQTSRVEQAQRSAAGIKETTPAGVNRLGKGERDGAIGKARENSDRAAVVKSSGEDVSRPPHNTAGGAHGR